MSGCICFAAARGEGGARECAAFTPDAAVRVAGLTDAREAEFLKAQPATPFPVGKLAKSSLQLQPAVARDSEGFRLRI